MKRVGFCVERANGCQRLGRTGVELLLEVQTTQQYREMLELTGRESEREIDGVTIDG